MGAAGKSEEGTERHCTYVSAAERGSSLVPALPILVLLDSEAPESDQDVPCVSDSLAQFYPPTGIPNCHLKRAAPSVHTEKLSTSMP